MHEQDDGISDAIATILNAVHENSISGQSKIFHKLRNTIFYLFRFFALAPSWSNLQREKMWRRRPSLIKCFAKLTRKWKQKKKNLVPPLVKWEPLPVGILVIPFHLSLSSSLIMKIIRASSLSCPISYSLVGVVQEEKPDRVAPLQQPSTEGVKPKIPSQSSHRKTLYFNKEWKSSHIPYNNYFNVITLMIFNSFSHRILSWDSQDRCWLREPPFFILT